MKCAPASEDGRGALPSIRIRRAAPQRWTILDLHMK